MLSVCAYMHARTYMSALTDMGGMLWDAASFLHIVAFDEWLLRISTDCK